MPSPNCTIQVTFFDQTVPSFAYLCISHPPAWAVDTKGNINPSSRGRVIRFDLDSVPTGAQFAGLRIAVDPSAIKNTNQPYLNDQNQTHIAIEHPATAAEPYIVINDDEATPSTHLWYSMGITLNGVTHWDDPRIYNPPGE